MEPSAKKISWPPHTGQRDKALSEKSFLPANRFDKGATKDGEDPISLAGQGSARPFTDPMKKKEKFSFHRWRQVNWRRKTATPALNMYHSKRIVAMGVDKSTHVELHYGILFYTPLNTLPLAFMSFNDHLCLALSSRSVSLRLPKTEYPCPQERPYHLHGE